MVKYQIKVVLDGEYDSDKAWSEAMTWEQVVANFETAHGLHNGDGSVGVGVKNLNDGRWIVDRMNRIGISLKDDFSLFIVKRIDMILWGAA